MFFILQNCLKEDGLFELLKLFAFSCIFLWFLKKNWRNNDKKTNKISKREDTIFNLDFHMFSLKTCALCPWNCVCTNIYEHFTIIIIIWEHVFLHYIYHVMVDLLRFWIRHSFRELRKSFSIHLSITVPHNRNPVDDGFFWLSNKEGGRVFHTTG